MAEVATLQLEWEALSRLTGDPKYAAAVQNVIDILDKLEKISEAQVLHYCASWNTLSEFVNSFSCASVCCKPAA